VHSFPSRGLAVPSGLLPDPPGQLRLAHRHARAIQAPVPRGRDRGRRSGHDLLAFVRGQLDPERLGRPLALLRRAGPPRQGAEQVAALGKADQRRHRPCDRGGARSPVDAQGAVPGTAAFVAGGAVVIGPREGERAEGRREGLRGAPGIPGQAPAPGAGRPRPRVVRGVGVAGLYQEARCQGEGLPAAGNRPRLEVARGGYAGPAQRRALAVRLRLEGRTTPPCWPAAGASSASAQRSHAAQ
jgi:hypothetical protein